MLSGGGGGTRSGPRWALMGPVLLLSGISSTPFATRAPGIDLITWKPGASAPGMVVVAASSAGGARLGWLWRIFGPTISSDIELGRHSCRWKPSRLRSWRAVAAFTSLPWWSIAMQLLSTYSCCYGGNPRPGSRIGWWWRLGRCSPSWGHRF